MIPSAQANAQAAGQRIAVIGAGISGLASAYLLARRHQVVLYEAAPTLGGHANTVDIAPQGVPFAVDTGFLVFNDWTYPNLIALFDELKVDTCDTDMSFGVSMDEGAFEWAGTNLDTVFAQRKRLLQPAFLGMLRDILRFNRAAHANLAACQARPVSLRQLLQEGGYGALFSDAYLIPMAAAIWSSSPSDILDFPAATFLRFCINHGLLQVNHRPRWRTVRGGSREYVRRIAATLDDVRLGSRLSSVTRNQQGVLVRSAGPAPREEQFDAVVFATHAPQTLALLQDATIEEHQVLAAVRYQANTAWLHSDLSLMPRLDKVWSAWNYLGARHSDGRRAVCVSYWLNRLQDLPCQSEVILTLNPPQPPNSASVMGRFDYEHPVFDQAAIDAQQRLPQIQGRQRAWFAGAWTGYGFHEDGLKSALRVVQDFGVMPDWATI
ncbi:dehydrogenase protein [Herbaspirillum rubrisubalbicans M1]|uniref:NAD(P)/FAD-dependent oxidoreductase n=1 Tax=Herbaspirillum rubrisubalbicans TaxID=80842 RepID=UPI00073A269B|nr:FAD-dependent oxidoreductase [Herbaspirillum rubrisubalbicans]ALU88070.1 dehydrogenase protein [Herbaspirillum rubrisubalbicans M1]